MSRTETTEITVTSSGEGLERDSAWSPTAMTNSNGPAGGPVRMTLAAGDNILRVPTGAMGIVITPPATSAITKRLKHYAGETGFAIRTAETAAVPLPTGVTTMMMNLSAEETVDIHWT